MPFASAIWLLGLIPWTGATLWLLLGRRQRIEVPFVSLWRGPVTAPKVKPAIIRPPISLLLIILGLLLCVLGAARPSIRSKVSPPVTIIIDHSITMSSRLNETKNRLASKIDLANAKIIDVPSADSRAHLHTAPQLNRAIRDQLNGSGSLIVVLTDQTIDVQDPRVIVLGPERQLINVGIVSISARAKPFPQVMVRVHDERIAKAALAVTFHVESGDHSTIRSDGGANGEKDFFLDLPTLGPTVSVTLEPTDQLPIDNQAWLAAESMAPTLVQSSGLPPTLQRMISVYQKHRQTGEKQAQIVTTDLSIGQTGAIVANDSTTALHPASLHVEPHPLTSNFNWATAVLMNGSGMPPPAWTPIVADGSRVFVAVREIPARQVWVCLNNPNWAATADYVIFWSNVFDWLGGGESNYQWHSVEESPDGQPGIENGKAYNAIDLQIPPFKQTPLPDLGKLAEGKLDLTPSLLIAAMLLIAVGIVLSGRTG